jgi:hypothetical protein
VKIPQDGNRANRNEHKAVVHEHVWRTLCSVCAAGARVAPPVYFVVLEVSPATLLFQLALFTGLVRVGVKIPQDGNHANRYGHVAVVRERDWRTLCSVCATGARVAPPVPCKVICRS